MGSDSTDAVTRLFDLLDQWRHFPAYQLERRADIFFALYLPGIIEHALGVKVDARVIPEFPIRKEHSRRSTKVDYLALSEDRSSAFLMSSRPRCEAEIEGRMLTLRMPEVAGSGAC